MSLFLLRRLMLSRSGKLHPFSLHNQISLSRLFSASSQDRKPTSLSERMSFLFDQIDALERERNDKDKTLQRIRAWRLSKDNPDSLQEIPEQSVKNDIEGGESGANVSNSIAAATLCNKVEQEEGEPPIATNKGVVVEMAHPWPEWIELMERLAQQNYFADKRRNDNDVDEDDDLGLVGDETPVGELVADFNDSRSVVNACLNFGKDRFDILRSISRRDIQVLVGYGCPNSDRKALFSSKLLRKHAHLDEGDVCSNCSMRSTCEKAYLLTNKYDEARTVDLMRVLLAYGLDSSHGTVTNKSLLKQKSVKNVVRKLLHEIVKLSAVPIDPNLPRPVIRVAPPKVKQPPPPPKKRVGRMDVEIKKGDWICTKCQFMNFAKNTACLQCEAKRPKRQLQPGEWECPQCNFLNYRRNMVCFHCECKRPGDTFVEEMIQEKPHSSGKDSDKMVKRADVSSSWNFNFDDDESDGADVAAFEYADSVAKPGGNAEWSSVSGNESREIGGVNVPQTRPGIGFDDFDDFTIDDLEIDSAQSSPSSSSSYPAQNSDDRKFSSRKFSRGHASIDSEDEFRDDKDFSNPSARAVSRNNMNIYSEDEFSDDRKSSSYGSRKISRSHMSNDSEDEYAPLRTRSSNGGRRKNHKADEESDYASETDDEFISRRRDGRKNGRANAFAGSKFGSRQDFDRRSRSTRSFRDSRDGSSENGRTRQRNGYGGEGERDAGEFRNSRRVIER